MSVNSVAQGEGCCHADGLDSEDCEAPRTVSDVGQQTGPELQRSLGLRGAVALNMLDMIGVGPFITLPLILAAMGGPQAMLGWVLGAVLALCDGLVWAELGAAMPEAGGSYAFLRRIYSPSPPTHRDEAAMNEVPDRVAGGSFWRFCLSFN